MRALRLAPGNAETQSARRLAARFRGTPAVRRAPLLIGSEDVRRARARIAGGPRDRRCSTRVSGRIGGNPALGPPQHDRDDSLHGEAVSRHHSLARLVKWPLRRDHPRPGGGRVSRATAVRTCLDARAHARYGGQSRPRSVPTAARGACAAFRRRRPRGGAAAHARARTVDSAEPTGAQLP